MGLGAAQDEAQLRPRKPFCRPRAFKNDGQKRDPKKERKRTARGRKWNPKWYPKIILKTDPKMDPNIISLRIGSLRLSGVGARPFRRKCRESRKGKGGLSYVAENET